MQRLTRHFWLPCLLAVFTSHAHAETDLAAAPKYKKRAPSTFAVPQDDDMPEKSYSPRKEPLLGLNGTVGYYYIGVGFGAEAWWNTPFRPLDVGLRFLYSQGELTSKDHGTDLAEVLDTDMTAIGAYGRYFFGESLNVTAALTHATLEGNFGYQSRDATNVDDTFIEFSSQRMLLELSIGHQWRLVTGHTFAVDWLGLGVTLSDDLTMGEDKFSSKGARVQERVEYFEKTTTENHLKKQLKDQTMLYILMLRFGTEF